MASSKTDATTLQWIVQRIYSKKAYNLYNYNKDKDCRHINTNEGVGEFINSSNQIKHKACESCMYQVFAEYLQLDVKYYEILIVCIMEKHCNLIKFIYHHSNLWFAVIVKFINTMHYAVNPKGASDMFTVQDLNASIHCIHLFKQKHWKFISFKCDFIIKVLQLIKKMILKWFHQNHQLSGVILGSLLVLLWKFLNFFSQYKINHPNKHLRSVLIIDKELTELHRVMESILLKLHVDAKDNAITFYVRSFYEAIHRFSDYQNLVDDNCGRFWKTNRQNDKCQRLYCKTIRGDKKHKIGWVKCSLCLVASYCSKRCAKYDWKYGNHKKYCGKYCELKKIKLKQIYSDVRIHNLTC
eukprot:251189_1